MMIREKILVIEDEKSISHFICTVLNNNGYEAMQAQTCLLYTSPSPRDCS